MKIRAAIVSFALVFASVPAFAQSTRVNGNGNNGSSNGTKDLSAQVADLEARVAKLEGNITSADLVGQYHFVLFDVPLSAAIPALPRSAAIETDMDSGTLTLDAQGGGTLDLTNCGSARLTQGPWTIDLQDCGSSGQQIPVTWTYGNGTLNLTLSDENETFPFTVASGGRLWTLGFQANHESDHSSDSLLMIVSRIQ